MLNFLQNCIHPFAVAMLAIWVYFFFGLVWGGFAGVRTDMSGEKRVYGGLIPWLFFLAVAVFAFIAWAVLVS